MGEIHFVHGSSYLRERVTEDLHLIILASLYDRAGERDCILRFRNYGG